MRGCRAAAGGALGPEESVYGSAVAGGEIDLDAILADFAIDERTPLTAAERSATIRQVIAARSGVCLPAAYAPANQDSERPERGSHAPGTHWFYNNWDYNVAGVIYEQATGEDLYESFERRLADPLGMEDWDVADGFRVYEPTQSLHPAHTFRISTRDLARFGQLYLNEGRWAGRQLLPATWVAESTRPHTDDGDGTGYGYMWWTYRAGSLFTARYPTLGKNTFYRGVGTGGQGLWVIPGAENGGGPSRGHRPRPQDRRRGCMGPGGERRSRPPERSGAQARSAPARGDGPVKPTPASQHAGIPGAPRIGFE